NNLGTTPITINTGIGLLTLTGYTSTSSVGGISTGGSIAYSYTLSAAQNTPAATESTDVIALTIQDAGGASDTANLTIQIIDDTPTANDDTNSIDEDGITPITGNVYLPSRSGSGDVADRQGADSNGTPITGVNFAATNGTLGSPLAGNYGYLTLNPDGSYSYDLDNNNPLVNTLKTGDSLTEVYTYTLTDADGDSTTATLTITINGNTDGAPSIIAADHNGVAVGENTVYEAGLISVSDTSEMTTGTIAISALDGLSAISVNGTVVTLSDLNNLATNAY
ncbi:VCBS domain-containing protein, partial [Methylocucumis oryzae]